MYARFFTNPDGFSDSTAYIVLDPDDKIWSINKAGGRSSLTTLTKGEIYRFVHDGSWTEINGVEALKLLADYQKESQVATTKTETVVIRKDRLIEAASKCGDAARILKTIFPEVFVDESPYVRISKGELGIKVEGAYGLVEPRGGGNLKDHGLYLPKPIGAEWSIITDSTGIQVAVCSRKK